MEWHNEEAARSMFSLVKSNNGLYRSIKQRDFMMTSNRGELAMCDWRYGSEMTPEHLEFFKSNFNIPDVKMTDRIISISGIISFAEYGRKSRRRVEHMFILDEFGCRGQYKLKFSYNDKEGSSGVNSAGTTRVFTRDDTIPLPVFVEEVKPEVVPSNYVGEVGKRQDFEGEIVYAAAVGESMYGTTYMTKVKIGDDMVTYWGLLKHIDYRGPVKFKATVKAHEEYKGAKQTIVNRPKVAEQPQEEVTA